MIAIFKTQQRGDGYDEWKEETKEEDNSVPDDPCHGNDTCYECGADAGAGGKLFTRKSETLPTLSL